MPWSDTITRFTRSRSPRRDKPGKQVADRRIDVRQWSRRSAASPGRSRGRLRRAPRSTALPGAAESPGRARPAKPAPGRRVVASTSIRRMQSSAWAAAVDRRLAAGPEQRGGAQAGFLRRHPDRFAAPPARRCRRPSRRELRNSPSAGIAHGVVHDAVVVRTQARDQGVVVGEGERRIRRIHPARAHAFAGDARQVRRDCRDRDSPRGSRRSRPAGPTRVPPDRRRRSAA